MKKYSLIILIILYNHLRAQSLSAIYLHLLPYSSTQKNVLSFPANQAALADYQHFALGVFGERRFLLNQLGLYDLVLALPTSGGNFGVEASYSGYSAQQETRLALAYARHMGQVSAGLQFNWHSFNTKGYEAASFISIEGGLLFQLSQSLRTGIHVAHTAGPPGRYYRVPALFTVGFGYDASPRFFVGLLFLKTEDREIQTQSGFEYNWQSLHIRAGLSTSTALFYFGVGLSFQDFRIDLTASLHPQLGVTPGLALLYPSTTEK